MTNTGTALVYVAHAEAASLERNTDNLHVGQYVTWQENLLALCGQNKTRQEDNKHQPQSEPLNFTEPEPTISNIAPQDLQKGDRVLNYGLQVIQLGILLIQLHDTEKEGDGECNLRNAKLLINALFQIQT